MDQRTNRAAWGEWRSPTGRARRGSELPPGWVVSAATLAMETTASTADQASFLVVSVNGLTPAAIDSFVASSGVSSSTPRLCLALSGDQLGTIDGVTFDPEHVGWMLDNVDAATPLAQLIDDRIEAIRFSSDFVSAAARQMRLGCALESMLSLAHELGLCTLGFDVVPSGATVTGRQEFDYIATAPAGERAAVPSQPRQKPREFSVTR